MKNIVIIFISLLLCLIFSLKSHAYEQYPYQAYPNYTDYSEEVEIGYPAIDELERKILGGVYAQEDVYERLNRLETKVFGQTTNEPLAERVDRLKAAVGISPGKQGQSAYRDQNIIFGTGHKRYTTYNNYKNNYNSYYDEYDRYEEDDFYDRYTDYQNMSTEASILSLILMILQSFL
ncbi:MAG: hypothetical protein GX568_00030 [Candidatus Gastranaerophilales bacterium]|nr:hypothetical protein [Candidatus Gastranaerophilales bacterium]